MIQEVIDGQSRIVLWYGPTKTAAAFRPLVFPPGDGKKEEPREVTLKIDDADPLAPFVDAETNSHWDIAGRAVDGKFKGWTLQWLDGVQVKWFAWAAEYPDTSVYEASETSK